MRYTTSSDQKDRSATVAFSASYKMHTSCSHTVLVTNRPRLVLPVAVDDLSRLVLLLPLPVCAAVSPSEDVQPRRRKAETLYDSSLRSYPNDSSLVSSCLEASSSNSSLPSRSPPPPLSAAVVLGVVAASLPSSPESSRLPPPQPPPHSYSSSRPIIAGKFPVAAA